MKFGWFPPNSGVEVSDVHVGTHHDAASLFVPDSLLTTDMGSRRSVGTFQLRPRLVPLVLGCSDRALALGCGTPYFALEPDNIDHRPVFARLSLSEDAQRVVSYDRTLLFVGAGPCAPLSESRSRRHFCCKPLGGMSGNSVRPSQNFDTEAVSLAMRQGRAHSDVIDNHRWVGKRNRLRSWHRPMSVTGRCGDERGRSGSRSS